MLVIKSPAKYPKQRDEWEHHADLLLEPGDHFTVSANGEVLFSEECPEGTLLHLHYLVAVEPEKLGDSDLWSPLRSLWSYRDSEESRLKERTFFKSQLPT